MKRHELRATTILRPIVPTVSSGVCRSSLAPLILALVLAFSNIATAQVFSVLHTFSGGSEGIGPSSGLTIDRAGNLYGVTEFDGPPGPCDGFGCGTVYQLKHGSSEWALTTLYRFQGGSDGAAPQARVVFGPDGALYGTTSGGGKGSCSSRLYSGCGTVFRLTPPATICKTALCPWNETVLYRFTGSSDGATPLYGDLTFDQEGNIYGTASTGGLPGCVLDTGCGVVFKLTRSQNQGWTESVLYSFTGQQDGQLPFGGVNFDHLGNLYGTTEWGGTSIYGTVYELTPVGNAWTNTVLYSFPGGLDGEFPYGGLIFDTTGNLYGTTFGVYGSVFELSPGSNGWTHTLLKSLPGDGEGLGGSYAAPFMDAFGNLYGTTCAGGPLDFGTVFKLLPSQGTWQYEALHNFTSNSDGSCPVGGIIEGANNILYGTTYESFPGSGVVFQITQ